MNRLSMAILGLGFVCRSHFHLRDPLFYCVPKVRPCLVSAVPLDEPGDIVKENNADILVPGTGDGRVLEWKKLNSKELGISSSMISRPAKKVLNGLKKKGYEVYLVGGSVRDLVLKRTPKDFDIITSAELNEVYRGTLPRKEPGLVVNSMERMALVRRTFLCCEIVGKRFPICHVHIDDTIVEVSSFSTSPRRFNEHLISSFAKPVSNDKKDYIRWKNCLHRDFTINGLMFDPFARIVYDYMGGMEDIRKAKVQTVIPAKTSFQEDCARILRAIRIAARLGFRLSCETAHSIRSLSYSVLRLDKGRFLMEVNYMLAYGSAEASLRLLWKFGLLEILLPIQAAYFVRIGFRRRDKSSNMLLTLFSNTDKLLAPDRPCHSSLWVGLLAFHKALCDKPRDPSVVAAFCLTAYNGGDISEAINIAKSISKPYDASYTELLEPQNLDSPALIADVLDLAASVKKALIHMTDEKYVSQAMAGYPKAPYSDLVFIPLILYLRTCRIFECIREDQEKGYVFKLGREIDYESLALGDLAEVRHVFARIVFDSVYPP